MHFFPAMEEPVAVKKISVQVRDDHLALLARAKPVNALAELIWNAFDADATEVRVEFAQNQLDGLDRIRVRDNGHGLSFIHALDVFRNLGGSWKQEGLRTPLHNRDLHGKYGKGRFRAFSLGDCVEWRSVFMDAGTPWEYCIFGRAEEPGVFELSEPQLAAGAAGMTVEITGLAAETGLLRGTKVLQEVTDLFALYLRQYPGLRLIYDGVPIDPTNAEEGSVDYDLGEMVMPDGERVRAFLTVVEWALPGKRGIILCNEHGFALHATSPRYVFRGFSYTAYLKSNHLSVLDNEGLLQVEDMSPDLKQLLDAARLCLRQHFTLRQAERAQDLLSEWRASGIYPYEAAPKDTAEETERRIFDIYATELSHFAGFRESSLRSKRLILRVLQELIRIEPTRVARLLDELVGLPGDMEAEVLDLMQG